MLDVLCLAIVFEYFECLDSLCLDSLCVLVILCLEMMCLVILKMDSHFGYFECWI